METGLADAGREAGEGTAVGLHSGKIDHHICYPSGYLRVLFPHF